MSNDLNLCQFIGRLGKDPETRYLPSGSAVTNFSIAVGSQWKDKNTGEKQERTEWVSVSAFGRLAEICGEYLKKGSQVYLSGEWSTRKWQDKSGQDRYATELKLQSMQMLGSRGAAAESKPEPDVGGFDDPLGDIPFAQFERGTVV